MESIWKPINSKKKVKYPTGYESNAERLVDYAQVHTSPRELRTLRVAAEVKRARTEGVLPTVAEIQARHNFTEEAAQSFIRSMQRVMRQNSTPDSNVRKPKQTPGLPSSFQPQVDTAQSASQEVIPKDCRILESALEFVAPEELSVDRLPSLTTLNTCTVELQAILQSIRTRYSDEIRIHGE